MCATVTDEDVGKRVETAGGDVLGTVELTEPETAYVDVNDDARRTLRAILEWESESNAAPIDDGAVGEVTGTAIRLEAGRSSPAEAGGTGPVIERDENTAGRDDADEQRTMGPPSGTPDELAASAEGWTGEGLEPADEGMTEVGDERHPSMADAPTEGERTVTEERGEEEDR
ncbi:hypothetical protein A6E15_11510 [Natrinema saccharevitans]|uniref:Uncharacterized protein n=1 Tax=Natrinema saccharevitans TaxID=301967 RepID=A0A1S8AXR3_9EURY|nr:hypothetical protein [Natrinema saccharevitans]OLZ41570.1 hypothetical protein A6E15_11510 [Natrinema saccharevitans]